MRFLALLAFTLPLCAGDAILHQTFTTWAEGWVAYGRGAGSIRASDGTLNFQFVANPSAVSVAVLPAAKLPLSDLKSIRFEIRSDVPMAVHVMLNERKPGGHYSAAVWSNGNSWQPVALAVSDFSLNDGPGDPVDPDDRLDLEQIEFISFIDVSQFFDPLARSREVQIFAAPHNGQHAISIRNFELSREPLPPRSGNALDDFSRPHSGWVTMGLATIDQSKEKMTAQYKQSADQFPVFSRTLPLRDYRNATHLAMDIASEQPAQFIVSLQQRRLYGAEGARYYASFFVPAGAVPEHQELALSAFNLDVNGPPGGRLDLGNIRSISFVDVTRESAQNKLTIRDLKMIRR